MKNKFRALLIVTLIFTLVLGTTGVASAKSKKKSTQQQYVDAYTHFSNSQKHKGKLLLFAYRKNAKVCELYRSTSAKGGYKKIGTFSNGNGIYVKAGSGMHFYKVRGVKGSKKGKFSSPVPSYETAISIASCNPDYADKSVVIKYIVNNKNGNSDMVFIKNQNQWLSSTHIFSKAEKKKLKEEGGWHYMYELQLFKGVLIDEDGNETDQVTVSKKTKGYVYVKYIYDVEAYSDEYEDIDMEYDNEEEAAQAVEKAKNDDAIKQIEFATETIRRVIKNNYKNSDRVAIVQPLKVKSGGKDYDFSASLRYEDKIRWTHLYSLCSESHPVTREMETSP